MNARCMALLGCVAGTMVAAAATIGPLKLDKPLLAHWAFDEATGEICRDASGHQADATLDRPAPGLERMAGVFDGGLSLSGRHLLRCGRQPAFDAVEKLSKGKHEIVIAFDTADGLGWGIFACFGIPKSQRGKDKPAFPEAV